MSASEENTLKDRDVVRRLTAADAAAYRAVMLDAYATHPSAFTSTVGEREGLPLSWWEKRLGAEANAMSVVYGAFDDNGVLVGAAGLSVEDRERARHKATLFGMSVMASARRAGFGRRLVQAVLDHARSHGGLRLVQLTVTEGNAAAQTLYERCGFQVFGVEPLAMAFDGGLLAKVHMWCDLEGAGRG
ncbi:RimJ/RimL family protein N-acetyltransferase [Variovorax boronicumulans]|uniref:GNAT family N-acetyltransferase n=1 Tax=Variovorax boronicumulans TaxID=436515 RepID=UPI0027851603|nr:GNAT family N-acetyltransferase [Variovorax boronicumulans]MDQ0071619.1 RimJ/RimL family protein N-acetyltransferase [Variovorax boronicumulans]